MSAEQAARIGFEAMQRGDGDVVVGWQNELCAAIASLLPSGALAKQRREQVPPGTAVE